jgi:hypothetical protein
MDGRARPVTTGDRNRMVYISSHFGVTEAAIECNRRGRHAFVPLLFVNGVGNSSKAFTINEFFPINREGLGSRLTSVSDITVWYHNSVR